MTILLKQKLKINLNERICSEPNFGPFPTGLSIYSVLWLLPAFICQSVLYSKGAVKYSTSLIEAGELESNSNTNTPQMCPHTECEMAACPCIWCEWALVYECMLGCPVCVSWLLCILSGLWLMTHHHDNTGGWDTFIHTKGPPWVLSLCHLICWEGWQLVFTPALCVR